MRSPSPSVILSWPVAKGADVTEYDVKLARVAARPTAVVAVTTTWEEYPTLWRGLLDEVYAFVRGGGATIDGHNVMLYLDDVANVEVGIQVTGTFTPAGRVVPSVLPAGPVAMAVHRGPYHGLDGAHRAVRHWCRSHGHQTTGVRWEIYGDWDEDPSRLETEIYYLLA
jgi:effector-binding domain-containing protein